MLLSCCVAMTRVLVGCSTGGGGYFWVDGDGVGHIEID